MKIIYLPLENLDQRYTRMWNNAIYPKVDISLYPSVDVPGQIKRGQFLDTVGTCKFKAAQLQMVADLFDAGSVANGDAFLVADIFYPGIEMINYMAELQGIQVSLYGFNHAGRADKTDFVQRLSGWADFAELGYHKACKAIFVGSEYHKKHVTNYFSLPSSKVIVTGAIWDLEYMRQYSAAIGNYKKEDFVIWPHRWSDEKGVDNFLQYASSTTKKIAILVSRQAYDATTDYYYLPSNVDVYFDLPKIEYYKMLASARWYLSTTRHENFGYTIQEAIYFRCNILVPDRACCPEMVPQRNVYGEIHQIDSLFDTSDLTVPMIYTEKWHNNAQKIVDIIRAEV